MAKQRNVEKRDLVRIVRRDGRLAKVREQEILRTVLSLFLETTGKPQHVTAADLRLFLVHKREVFGHPQITLTINQQLFEQKAFRRSMRRGS